MLLDDISYDDISNRFHYCWLLLSLEGACRLCTLSERVGGRLLSEDVAPADKPRVLRSHQSTHTPSTAAQPIKDVHSNGVCSYGCNQIEMHSLWRDLSFLNLKKKAWQWNNLSRHTQVNLRL